MGRVDHRALPMQSRRSLRGNSMEYHHGTHPVLRTRPAISRVIDDFIRPLCRATERNLSLISRVRKCCLIWRSKDHNEERRDIGILQWRGFLQDLDVVVLFMKVTTGDRELHRM